MQQDIRNRPPTLNTGPTHVPSSASESALDRSDVSDSELRTKDFMGLVLGVIITLGPLAATALWN